MGSLAEPELDALQVQRYQLLIVHVGHWVVRSELLDDRLAV